MEHIDFASQEAAVLCANNRWCFSCSLWFSCPCTGGSSWQNYNMTRGDSTVKLIKGHCKKYRMLWSVFEKVSIPAIARGASIFVEWPHGCASWKHREVVTFVYTYDFEFAEFGCKYGLVANSGPDQGKPINKPWKVAFNKDSISDCLNRKCDCSHTHAACSGQNAKGTEDYTPEIARAVHLSFKADVVKGLKAFCAGVLHVMPAAPIARAPAACCLALGGNALVSSNEVILVQRKTAPLPAPCHRGLLYEFILRMADSARGTWRSGRLGNSSALVSEMRRQLPVFSASVNVIGTIIKDTQQKLQLILHPDKQPTGTSDYRQRQILCNRVWYHLWEAMKEYDTYSVRMEILNKFFNAHDGRLGNPVWDPPDVVMGDQPPPPPFPPSMAAQQSTARGVIPVLPRSALYRDEIPPPPPPSMTPHQDVTRVQGLSPPTVETPPGTRLCRLLPVN
eukprot:16442982-Heterocapsa_arctica.AAC.1